jgi:dTDP-4-dehydrorhamnose 3,5-epimerase
MHTLTKSPILGLDIVRPFIFKDYRGEYAETYNQQEILPGLTFVQDSAILSKKNVLRGYHGDNRTTKLVTCLHGAFQIAVVCIDPMDERYMIPETFILDDKERQSLVVPPRFVNAHMCLTNTCLFFYKQDTFYKGQKYQYSVRWDMVRGVMWPCTPILSKRDAFDAKYPDAYATVDDKHSVLLPPEEVNP